MQLFVHFQQTHTLDVQGTETVEDVKVCTVIYVFTVFFLCKPISLAVDVLNKRPLNMSRFYSCFCIPSKRVPLMFRVQRLSNSRMLRFVQIAPGSSGSHWHTDHS